MKNVRVAAVAAYHMSRFDSNLGHPTAAAAFQRIEQITDINADTIKAVMRDSFDHWYPWRKGWDVSQSDPPYHTKLNWENYGLKEVFSSGNQFSEDELRKMLVMFGVWADS